MPVVPPALVLAAASGKAASTVGFDTLDLTTLELLGLWQTSDEAWLAALLSRLDCASVAHLVLPNREPEVLQTVLDAMAPGALLSLTIMSIDAYGGGFSDALLAILGRHPATTRLRSLALLYALLPDLGLLEDAHFSLESLTLLGPDRRGSLAILSRPLPALARLHALTVLPEDLQTLVAGGLAGCPLTSLTLGFFRSGGTDWSCAYEDSAFGVQFLEALPGVLALPSLECLRLLRVSPEEPIVLEPAVAEALLELLVPLPELFVDRALLGVVGDVVWEQRGAALTCASLPTAYHPAGLIQGLYDRGIAALLGIPAPSPAEADAALLGVVQSALEQRGFATLDEVFPLQDRWDNADLAAMMTARIQQPVLANDDAELYNPERISEEEVVWLVELPELHQAITAGTLAEDDALLGMLTDELGAARLRELYASVYGPLPEGVLSAVF